MDVLSAKWPNKFGYLRRMMFGGPASSLDAGTQLRVMGSVLFNKLIFRIGYVREAQFDEKGAQDEGNCSPS